MDSNSYQTKRCISLLVTLTGLLFVILPLFSEGAFARQITLSGTVVDAEDGQPLPGVNVGIIGTVVGTATDSDGEFSIDYSGDPPVILSVSSVGYSSQQIEITSSQAVDLLIELQGRLLVGDDVVVSASRYEESIIDAPVTIEKMDILSIVNSPADTYYKALANLKGVDMTSSSINFQIINSRGFNATGNNRMVQMIDGMDTQAPALNFPISNLNGPTELDVESIEYLPGAASALYGPNAFSGVLLINSKSPFDYPGISATVKAGANHFNGNTALGEPANPEPMYDFAVRVAESYNNKFAYKVNFSYSQASDWQGINYSDKNSNLYSGFGVNPAYDGVHMYGDDGSFNIGLLGINPSTRQALAGVLVQQFGGALSQQDAEQYIASLPAQPVNRTGYVEKYLVDYGAENMKVNASLHYRLSDLVEASYTFNYGYGTSVYTGAQRYSLKNFYIHQHKLELLGDNFLVKAYGTFENSGDSYIADFVGYSINEAYRPSAPNLAAGEPGWFGTYGLTFTGALIQGAMQAQNGSTDYNSAVVNGLLSSPLALQQFHQAARSSADQGRLQPLTDAFESAKQAALESAIPNGALFDDSSLFYHVEGQYDFKNEVDFVDLLAGASYRQFRLRSNGTVFDDEDGVNINEVGAFLQASKAFGDDLLKLTGAVRYDKNENFDGQFSPRISAVVGLADNHNLRVSYQTGFRNPSTQAQYIDLNVITARLLGGLPRFAEDYAITENTYTYSSVQNFTDLFLQNPSNPQNVGEAIGELVPYSTHNPVKPEQIQVFEVGYKSLLSDRLMVDAAYYHNTFNDFISQIRVRRAAGPINLQNPQQAAVNAASLLNGDFNNTYQIYTNIDNTIRAHGVAVGFEYSLPSYYAIRANYNWNKLITDITTFQNDYNTPEHKFNVSFGNRRLTDRLGFNITYRWQDAFRWETTFVFMDVEAVSTVDAQVTYRLPQINSVLKAGGSNILNNQHILNGGGPSLGAIYYLSLTFDSLLRR